MGPAENDERPGETGPEDGFRAGGAPSAGTEPGEQAPPDDGPDRPAGPPVAPGLPDALARPVEEPVAVTNGTPAHVATPTGPGRGSVIGSANGSGVGPGAGTGSGGGSAAAVLRSAPDWDPSTSDPPPAGLPTAVEPSPTGGPPAPPDPPPTTRSGRPEPAPRTHRWGIGAYLVVEVIFLGTSLLISQLLASDGPPDASALAIALAVPTVLTAAAALLITRLRGNGPVVDLGLRPTWRDVGLGVAFGVGGLVITIPASVLFVAIVGEDATSAVGDVFGDVSASLPWAIAVFLIVVLVAPLCEEIVYRGLLWGGVERLAGPRAAFGVSTLLFALAHFEFARTPLLLVVALPIAAARYYTGKLTASVVAHQINNLLPGVVLLLALLGLAPLA